MHQVGDLFELNVKLRCQKVKGLTSTVVAGKSEQSDQQVCMQEERDILFGSSGMWRSVAGWVVPDFRRSRSAFISNRYGVRAIRNNWSHPTRPVPCEILVRQPQTTGHTPQDLCPVKYLCYNLKSGIRDYFEWMLTHTEIILSEEYRLHFQSLLQRARVTAECIAFHTICEPTGSDEGQWPD